MILTLIDLFYYCNYENNTTVLEKNHNFNQKVITVVYHNLATRGHQSHNYVSEIFPFNRKFVGPENYSQYMREDKQIMIQFSIY